MSGTDALGWVATTLFVSSYFFRQPALLRAAQMSGAALWIVYGALIGAIPVVVANGLVFGAAAWTLVRDRSTVPAEAPQA
jgi:Bacterial inner membrane protein